MSLSRYHRPAKQARTDELALFDPFFNSVFSDLSRPFQALESFGAPLDIHETAATYEVVADLPGVPKEDVKVTVKDHVLTISGKREKVKKVDTDKYHREERSFGSFSRSIAIPENADENTIKAKYDNGVLSLTLTKTTPAPEEGVKKITIE